MSEYIDPSKRDEFKLLQLEGKRLASVGDLEESLKKFELAKRICPTPKVLQRIEKLKECLKTVYVPSRDSEYTPHSSTEDDTNVSPDLPQKYTNTNTHVEPEVLSDIQNIQCHRKSSMKISESSDLSPQSQLKFKKLKKEGKEFAYSGEYENALNSFKKALNIFDCANVKKYIKKIELVISSNEEAMGLEDKSDEKKLQHTSDSVRESTTNYETSILSTKVKEEKNFKDPKESTEKKTSLSSGEEPLQPKISVSSVLTSNSEEINNLKDPCNKEETSLNSGQEPLQEKSSLIVREVVNKSDTERKLASVKVLYEEARELAAEGRLKDALKVLGKAQSIHETQKVQKRIEKLEELLSGSVSDTEDSQMVEIAKDFFIFHEIYNKLYPYQREGVAWMWKLYNMGKGGVLGDDMGLGKTFQIIAFISGMIDADLVKHVLIIMPVSLLKNWEREFKKWCPGIAVHDFHSGSKKERERNLLRVQRRGHVLLTSYGMIVTNVNSLTEMDGREFVWDYVILDEGHKIKNPTKTTKAVYEIPAKNRLVLTGTPIQNNLKELWSLYDFVHQGTLLGSLKTFKLQYETPITRSREKDATSGEKRLGSEIAGNLKALIKPYFLRRTKEEIWGKKDDDVDQLGEQMENMKISKITAKKNDLILWAYMSDQQIAIYQDFLHSNAVKEILVSKRSPLVELTTLKKICDHPRLLSQRACFHLGLNGDLQKEDLEDMDDELSMASSIDNVTDENLLKESGKLNLVIDLLNNLKENGHRTLVFSLSRKILDMIHRILTNRNWKVMRLDGTITKTVERERRIQRFQTDSSYPVFLLTTQVGGVGITLTAADRVIIYDPSWNPATDAQAVDRVYRIGQEKNVIVYRLITCGTVEEKIYRRQIFKDSITRQTTGAADPYRYFSKQELRELFSLENARYSATQVQLHEMHSSQRRSYAELEEHMAFLQTLDIFGISDHDLMFTKEVTDQSEDNDPGAISEHFIKQKVAAAHDLIKMEASVVAEGIRLAGTYNRPYQETIPLSKKGLKDAYKPPVLPDVIDLTEAAQDNMFPSYTEKKAVLSPKNTSDVDIQMLTPNKENEEAEEKYSSPIEEKSNVDDQKQKSSLSKHLKNLSMKEDSPNSKNPSNEVITPEKFERSVKIDTFNNIEKLRKSSFINPSAQDEDVASSNEDQEMNLSVTCVNTHVGSDDDEEEKVPAELNTLEKVSNYQIDATPLKIEDLADLSFGNSKDLNVSIRKGRKSCARRTTVYLSESDTSRPNSPSSLNASDKLVDESENDSSEEEDSSNSASISFVPDSVPGTPHSLEKSHSCVNEAMSETPSKSYRFKPELQPKTHSVTPDSSVLKKLEGSFKRITPLKVDRCMTQEDSSFVQAMATSLILTPNPSPEKTENVPAAVTPSNYSAQVPSDDDDSPLKFRKKKVKHLCSDSEESDNDSENENDLSDDSDVELSDHSSLSHCDEVEESHSENGLNKKDHSSVLEDNHSIAEHSLNETDNDSLSDEQSDLERTFATCKDEIESNSEEESDSSESSEEHSDSGESASIFSEDD